MPSKIPFVGSAAAKLVVAAVVAGLFPFISCKAQTFDRPSDAFKVGPWEGAAQFLDDGSFFSCLMVADYGGKQSAAFGINRNYNFWFGVSSDDWQLDSSKTYRITYTIDQLPPVVLRASAPYPNMVMADFTNNTLAFQQLRQAKQLTVDIPELNHSIRLGLENTDSALPVLANCVERNAGNRPNSRMDDIPPVLKKEI